MKEVRHNAVERWRNLSERTGQSQGTNRVCTKVKSQSVRKGEQREVEEEKELKDGEKWLRKMESKGNLHHLSRASPREGEVVLTIF